MQFCRHVYENLSSSLNNNGKAHRCMADFEVEAIGYVES